MRKALVIGVIVLSLPALSFATRPSVDRDHRGQLRAPTAEQARAIADLPEVSTKAFDENGVPSFLAGRLGHLESGDTAAAAVRFLKGLGLAYRATGREEIEVTRTIEDGLGQVHVRVQMHYRGLPIVGADMVVHAKKGTGEVFAVNGRFVPAENLPTRPATNAHKAIGNAVLEAGLIGATVLGEPELTYVVGPDGKVFLAWSAMVSHTDAMGEELDRLFADAVEGGYITRHAQIHYAKNRKIYDANYRTRLPGTLVLTEGGSSSDTTVMAAYDNSGYTYDYYQSRFGRDSYDGNGADLISTVHYGSDYNNAYWNGSQMVFGDGDGTVFGPIAAALDVVAHELTHAVTDRTADLTYQNESGALNEAMSDIFAASAEAWVNGGMDSNTWKVGEDCYTPATAGDALRYMDDPTADGSSYDYYPERYTGTQDYGGVHWNSGIGNLAYVLLTQGGTHPRNKTTVYVNGIGMTKAEQVLYRALTVYMTSSTNFEGARNTTAQAADDLYGSTEVESVQQAWDAVGVPGGPITVDELVNGVPVSNLAGSTGAEDYYTMPVPSGSTDLLFQITGGSGDADLYVKFGSMPTTSSYDCRPYNSGNEETCSWASPTAGDWYVMIRAYSSYSGVTLTGSYTNGSSNAAPAAGFSYSTSDLTATFTDTSTDSDGSVTAWSWSFGDGYTSTTQNPVHTYAASGTYTVSLTVTDNDGATDSASTSVTVTAPVTNDPPTANFSFTTTDLTATFTDASSDPDGSVTAWSWGFGDSATSTTRDPVHTYTAAGTYTVSLTVTDNDGATDSVSKSVTVTEPAGGDAPCTDCDYYSGNLSGAGDYDVQPNGNYYYASSGGYHKGWLEGPAGTDYDLYLYRYSGGRWRLAASSTSASSSESVSYYYSSAGYFYWKVSSYSGSGSYDLWLDTP